MEANLGQECEAFVHDLVVDMVFILSEVEIAAALDNHAFDFTETVGKK